MYNKIFIIMISMGVICIFLAVLLTAVWNVLDIADELTDRKAKRQIKRIHQLNSSTGSIDRMSTTDVYETLSESGSYIEEPISKSVKEKYNDNSEEPTSMLEDSVDDGRTMPLGDSYDNDVTKPLDLHDEESTSFLEDVKESVKEKEFIVVKEELTSL